MWIYFAVLSSLVWLCIWIHFSSKQTYLLWLPIWSEFLPCRWLSQEQRSILQAISISFGWSWCTGYDWNCDWLNAVISSGLYLSPACISNNIPGDPWQNTSGIYEGKASSFGIYTVHASPSSKYNRLLINIDSWSAGPNDITFQWLVLVTVRQIYNVDFCWFWLIGLCLPPKTNTGQYIGLDGDEIITYHVQGGELFDRMVQGVFNLSTNSIT